MAISRLLHDAVIRALKEAHAAYLAQHMENYRKYMKVAECAIEAIRSLGVDEDNGREMELMCLEAEITLMHTLSGIHCPEDMISHYEMAALQMLLPPSQVISGDDPLLPHCKNALDFFGGPCEQVAGHLDRATALYSQLTDGGGGGVAEIYRAQLARQQGCDDKARQWARLALERMRGDKWIEPIAQDILRC